MKQQLVRDMIRIWLKAGLPVINEVPVVRKLSTILNKIQASRKKAIILNEQEDNEK